MPEYLAPGVYVEEVDTGSKPIEGVSTSTAGMFGVTERGPANVPILVTSNGEYQRWFGGGLNRDLYGEHRFLPNAIEGFFTNGGKRVYLTRILATDQASAASAFVFNTSAPVPATTALLRPVTTAAPATAYLADLAGMAVTTPRTWLQIGSGGDIEFAKLDALPGGENDVKLDRPLSSPHASGEMVERLAAAGATFDAATTLAGAIAAGAISIKVAALGGAIVAGQFIELRTAALGAGDAELAQVNSIDVPNLTIVLQRPLLFARPNGVDVRRLVPPAAWTNTTTVDPAIAASPGESVLHMPFAARANYLSAGDLVKIGPAGATQEVRRIGGLTRVALKSRLVRDYDQGTLFEVITETAVAGLPRKTTRPVEAGSSSVQLGSRIGLNEGDVLRIGLAADAAVEYAQIKQMPNRGLTPDAGLVILETPLANRHDVDTGVEAQTFARAASGVSALAVAATKNGTQVVASGALAGVAANSLLRILPASGVATIHKVGAAPVALTPRIVTLAPAASKPHAASTAIQSTVPLFEVRALDAGQWGERLRVAVREPSKRAVESAVRAPAALGIPDATHLRLEPANGIEVGTVLQRWDPAVEAFTGPAFKAIAVDRLNGFLLTLDQSVTLSPGDVIRSHEFDLEVHLLRQPDKANPTRDSAVIESEAFRALTLDPRHSRYLHRVVGVTWDMQAGAIADDEGNALRLEDRRSGGESNLVRVRDVALDLPTAQIQVEREAVRIGPRFDLETLSDGRTRPTRYALRGGNDQLSSVDDDTYIGQDNVDPERRTGLYTLRNVEEISIVGAPGRTSPRMQNELISHCELLRYRFAVLDAAPPPNDSMANVQAQRKQFDTKYAALYHPWLVIPDPYPSSAGTVPDYPIPPSGHMIGVYARTDIERGVHKAPANEVVRGVIGLQRLLNKEQHDILNPYPVNINVIRDFRNNSRGIRVYGGRVITSDPDWKYVNVRRLLIFIESSVDRGLQWVVFEPNAEPLWARVRRSISNFLTLIWRNGGLEGTKPEEAYFVKCDRTTMTQTDIDSGRLICVVGVAPVKPAEFVIVRIGLWTAHADE